jgi:hypothetical protein
MFDKAGVILDRREMLKVKVKSLMEEAQIIRKEERKAKGKLRSELHEHRVRTVRLESRLTHIAYGFVRGRSLTRTEPVYKNGLKASDWKRILGMYISYGSTKHIIDRSAAEAAFKDLQGVVPGA